MSGKNTQDSHENLEHERLTSLINTIADGVIATDEAGTVELYNGAALDILDLNSSIAGQSLSRLLRLLDSNNQVVDVQEVILKAKTRIAIRDFRIKYSDNSYINVYLSVSPVRLGYGRKGAGGFVLLLRDITREKSLEEERDEFISVISHELRTPIAIAEGNISNAQYLLTKTNDVRQVRQALKQTYEQISFLSGMINDLSTLSRAERGNLALDITGINVYQLLGGLAESYQQDATAQHITIATELDPHLELLYSSQLYIREILQNFITNALKYTKTGKIILAAKQHKSGVQFQVIDTGIGISRSDQEKIFDKFFRSEDYRTRETNGTGLGLYVTMKLARLIHADITLESELNHGSTFTIFAPNLKQ